jgi:hypothetical protein
MAGFVGDPDHFLKFILVFLLFNMVAASMFYLISIAVPSVSGNKNSFLPYLDKAIYR